MRRDGTLLSPSAGQAERAGMEIGQEGWQTAISQVTTHEMEAMLSPVLSFNLLSPILNKVHGPNGFNDIYCP